MRANEKVSTKYWVRLRLVNRVMKEFTHQTGVTLQRALQWATIHECYERTPLPISLKLFHSIGWEEEIKNGEVGVSVGYNVGMGDTARRPAPHARYRLNMKGISVYGGHMKDMNPQPLVMAMAGPVLRRIQKKAIKGILEGYVPVLSDSLPAPVVTQAEKAPRKPYGAFRDVMRRIADALPEPHV